MTKRKKHPPGHIRRRVLELIYSAIENGEVAPSERFLSREIDTHKSNVWRGTARLIREGLIGVEIIPNGRVITRLDTGASTAMPPRLRDRQPRPIGPRKVIAPREFRLGCQAPPATRCQYVSEPCDRPVREGSSYCELHHALCYQKIAPEDSGALMAGAR